MKLTVEFEVDSNMTVTEGAALLTKIQALVKSKPRLVKIDGKVFEAKPQEKTP